jgi:hypothetical protein
MFALFMGIAQHRKKLFSVPIVRLNAIMHGGIVFISFLPSTARSSSSLQMPPNHFVSSFLPSSVRSHGGRAEGLCRIASSKITINENRNQFN